jgi:hypothetical protein
MLYRASALRQNPGVVRKSNPCLRRCGRWLWLAGWLAAATVPAAHAAEPAEANALPPLKFSDLLAPAQPANAAPKLKPTDDFDVSYNQKSTAPGPEAVARGRTVLGEDAVNASYARPVSGALDVQTDGSLRFPQQLSLADIGAAQGGLAVNSLGTRAVYAGSDDWSLKPFASHSMWNYQDRSLALTNDHSTSSIGLDTNWQLTRRTKLTSGLQGQQVDYTTSASSYRSGIASFGIEQQLPGQFKAAASLGTEMREEPDGRRLVNPSNDLNLSYTLPSDAKLTVGRRQAVQQSYQPDYYEDASEAYYSQLTQSVLPNLQLDTSAALEFAGGVSSGQPTRSECWQFQLAPTYHLRDNLSAQIGYSLKVYTLPAIPNQTLDNCMFLSLKFSY